MGRKGFKFHSDFIAMKFQPGLKWQELLEENQIK